jgi:hypothetical protein
MHGLILSELKKYVDTRLGGDTWRTLLREAGIGVKIYLPTQTYPDTEVVSIITTASRLSNTPVTGILEDFGEFIVPDLIGVYGAYIKPEWRTLDLILNTEETMHRVVRTRNPGAAPPELKVVRTAPDEVAIEYTSQRKMCAIARGIVKGVAGHYREQVTVAEPECQLRGDSACKIMVKAVA